MITEIKTFMCNEIPSEEDIEIALKIAKENKIIVELHWPVYISVYSVTITPEDTVQSVKNNMPKVYGL